MGGKKKTDREFCWDSVPKRHICLRFMYHGQLHDGLAKQDHTANTVEGILVEALRKVRLINPDPAVNPEKFSRCARTDKGVSAFSNAVSLVVRASCGSTNPFPTGSAGTSPTENTVCSSSSNSTPGVSSSAISVVTATAAASDGSAHTSAANANGGAAQSDAKADGVPPLDYCKMLNHALPSTIRVTGWAFCPEGFDARFSCIERTYRYYMNFSGLDMGRMTQALSYLVGEHDFRNLAKMDVVNVSNFVREVRSARIVLQNALPAAGTEGAPDALQLGYLEIIGNAFLYHQIRCIVTVLVLIGKRYEEPTLIQQLLDVAALPAKPCYPLADDMPLVLWDCRFKEIEWQCSEDARAAFVTEARDIATALMIRSQIASDMAGFFSPSPAVDVVSTSSSNNLTTSTFVQEKTSNRMPVTGVDWTGPRAPTGVAKKTMQRASWEEGSIGLGTAYMPMMTRPREMTFDERVAALSDNKRRRREDNISKGTTRAGDEVDGDE